MDSGSEKEVLGGYGEKKSTSSGYGSHGGASQHGQPPQQPRYVPMGAPGQPADRESTIRADRQQHTQSPATYYEPQYTLSSGQVQRHTSPTHQQQQQAQYGPPTSLPGFMQPTQSSLNRQAKPTAPYSRNAGHHASSQQQHQQPAPRPSLHVPSYNDLQYMGNGRLFNTRTQKIELTLGAAEEARRSANAGAGVVGVGRGGQWNGGMLNSGPPQAHAQKGSAHQRASSPKITPQQLTLSGTHAVGTPAHGPASRSAPIPGVPRRTIQEYEAGLHVLRQQAAAAEKQRELRPAEVEKKAHILQQLEHIERVRQQKRSAASTVGATPTARQPGHQPALPPVLQSAYQPLREPASQPARQQAPPRTAQEQHAYLLERVREHQDHMQKYGATSTPEERQQIQEAINGCKQRVDNWVVLHPSLQAPTAGDNATTSSGESSNAPSGSGASKAGMPRRKHRCGWCEQTGHNQKNCPKKKADLAAGGQVKTAPSKPSKTKSSNTGPNKGAEYVPAVQQMHASHSASQQSRSQNSAAAPHTVAQQGKPLQEMTPEQWHGFLQIKLKEILQGLRAPGLTPKRREELLQEQLACIEMGREVQQHMPRFQRPKTSTQRVEASAPMRTPGPHAPVPTNAAPVIDLTEDDPEPAGLGISGITAPSNNDASPSDPTNKGSSATAPRVPAPPRSYNLMTEMAKYAAGKGEMYNSHNPAHANWPQWKIDLSLGITQTQLKAEVEAAKKLKGKATSTTPQPVQQPVAPAVVPPRGRGRPKKSDAEKAAKAQEFRDKAAQQKQSWQGGAPQQEFARTTKAEADEAERQWKEGRKGKGRADKRKRDNEDDGEVPQKKAKESGGMTTQDAEAVAAAMRELEGLEDDKDLGMEEEDDDDITAQLAAYFEADAATHDRTPILETTERPQHQTPPTEQQSALPAVAQPPAVDTSVRGPGMSILQSLAAHGLGGPVKRKRENDEPTPQAKRARQDEAAVTPADSGYSPSPAGHAGSPPPASNGTGSNGGDSVLHDAPDAMNGDEEHDDLFGESPPPSPQPSLAPPARPSGLALPPNPMRR